MNWLHFIIAYLLLVNVVTFFTYGIDKYKAKNGEWRISEATLLLMAFFLWQYRCMAWDEDFSSQDHAQEVLYRGADNHHTATCACGMACL